MPASTLRGARSDGTAGSAAAFEVTGGGGAGGIQPGAAAVAAEGEPAPLADAEIGTTGGWNAVWADGVPGTVSASEGCSDGGGAGTGGGAAGG
jgi:hypothetical protein